MVGGADDHAVARHRIHVEQKRGHDALDLTSFLGVGSFLADAIELIEEQYAGRVRDVFDDLLQARGRLAEIASDESLVSDGEERQCKLEGERRGKACLARTGRTNEQNLVSRLKRMRAQERCFADFANEVLQVADDPARENEVGDPSGRLGFAKEAAQGFGKHGGASARKMGRPRQARGRSPFISLLGILAVGFANQRRHGVAY